MHKGLTEAEFLALTSGPDDPWINTDGTWGALPNTGEPVNSCGFFNDILWYEICQRNLLLELAETPDSMTLHTMSGSGALLTYEFPPQSAASQALLKEMEDTIRVDRVVDVAFTSNTTAIVDNCSTQLDNSTLTKADELMIRLQEAYRLQREANESAANAYVGLSHMKLGAPSDVEFNAKTMEDIRIHASRILVGNRVTSPIVLDAPSRFTLSGSGKMALELIRKAAVNPDRIVAFDGLSYTDQKAALSSLIADMQTRLGSFAGDATVLSEEEFLDSHAVDVSAMAEARRFLADEIRFWGRDSSTLLPEYTDPLGGLWSGSTCRNTQPDSCLYAATANPPRPNDYRAYFSSLPIRGQVQSLELDPLLAHLRRLASIHLALRLDTTTAPPAYRARVLDKSSQVLGSLKSETSGIYATAIVSDGAGSVNGYIAVAHPTSNEHLRLVQSTRALQCATSGRIDGVPCTWAAIQGEVKKGDPQDGFNSTERTVANEMGLTNRTVFGPIPAGPAFVLEPRPGASGETPGGYRLVVARWIEAPMAYTPMAISPRRTQWAGEILMRDPTQPNWPLLRCEAGDLTTDGRVPLENEITADGDAYESSWRHLLQLAKQAADEADALGQETWSAGEQIDRLAEDSLRNLEDLCGVTLSLDPLQEAMAASPAANPLDLIDETTLSNPDMEKLQACIGDTALREFTSLGSDALCLWYRNGDRHAVCGLGADAPDAVKKIRCPHRVDANAEVVTTAADCATLMGLPATAGSSTYTAALVAADDLLEYYPPLPIVDPPLDDNGNDDPPLNCGLIRETAALQKVGTDKAQYDKNINALFRDNSAFAKETLKVWGRGIRWEARPGTHSTLYVNDQPVATTDSNAVSGVCSGNDLNIPGNRWDCSSGAGLLCTLSACGTQQQRAEVNEDLVISAAVARWLGQTDLSGFKIPGWRDWELFQAWSPQGDPQVYSLDGITMQEFGRQNGADAEKPGRRFSCALGQDVPTWWWPANSESGTRTTRCHADGHYGLNIFAQLQDSQYMIDIDKASLKTDAIATAGNFIDRIKSETNNPFDQLWTSRDFVDTTCQTGGTTCAKAETNLPWWNRDGYVFDGDWYRDAALVRFLDRNRSATEIKREHLWGALELLCEAAQPTTKNYKCGVEAKDLTGPDQMDYFVSQIECFGNQVSEKAVHNVLVDLPDAARDALRDSGSTGALDGAGGQFAEEMATVRQNLIEAASIPPKIKDLTDAAADQARQMKHILNQIRAEDSIDTWSMVGSLSAAANDCAQGWKMDELVLGLGFLAATNCADAVIQGIAAVAQWDLKGQIKDEQRQIQYIDTERQLKSIMSEIRAASDSMLLNLEAMDAALGRAERIRQNAKVELAQALFLDSDDTGHVFRSNTSLRRRFGTAQIRYARARRAAIRLAFLAKLAIEQRFGVHLSDITKDLALVDAPASWESSVCMSSGIDYTRLRDATGSTDGEFADEFVGDYVRKLELFVESYSFDYPFSNAADTAVVSLRDDIANVRTMCAVPSNNLLAFSSNLDQGPTPDSEGWEPYDVATNLNGEPEPNAVFVEPWTDRRSFPNSRFGIVEPHTIAFGSSAPLDPICATGTPDFYCCDNAYCGWKPTTTLAQTVLLQPGWYRLSWYDVSSISVDATTQAISFVSPGNAVVSVAGAEFVAGFDPYGGGGSPPAMELVGPEVDPGSTMWARHWRVFALTRETAVTIHIGPAVQSVGETADIAGLMLEDVSGLAYSISPADQPGGYEPTGEGATIMRPVCEDTDGEIFREKHWRRKCIQLCEDGFGVDCAPHLRTTYCYWETDFTVTQEAIDRSLLFRASGFARGNFNYRVDTIGVNFVGTAARQCADSTLPSTCYNAGFIPYSIEHIGPYEVRNYSGDNFDARLFTGRIEHARGLAAERYLTNPLSSADRALIEPYYQGQFTGRPLTGTYRLRVWEEPGVNFEGIEDVQIVLNYRHWTRLN